MLISSNQAPSLSTAVWTLASWNTCFQTKQLTTQFPLLHLSWWWNQTGAKNYWYSKSQAQWKIIILQNILYVPSLQEPLYSLCQHQMLSECGYYSNYNTDSHLLFPHFVLKIDTSVDNILSYESTDMSNTSNIDYAKPRVCTKPRANPAHIIEPEPDKILQVKFNYMPPKSSKVFPAHKAPSPSPPPQMSTPSPNKSTLHASVTITNDELITESTKPLSKKIIDQSIAILLLYQLCLHLIHQAQQNAMQNLIC